MIRCILIIPNFVYIILFVSIDAISSLATSRISKVNSTFKFNHNGDNGIQQPLHQKVEEQHSRRDVLYKLSVAMTIANIPLSANAAETIGKDDDCNESSCLGVWDGLLADCPHGLKLDGNAACVSSQDDTPGIFAEPWDYSEAPNNSMDWQAQMRLLIPAIQLVSSRRGDQCQILLQSDRYLRVLFIDGKSTQKSIGEFYFTPNDTTVQFRVGALTPSSIGDSNVKQIFLTSLKNKERCELIRKELRYLKLPVLRNRKRTLFFVESDFDTFGPGSAALGPPAEMTSGELEGRDEDRYPKTNKVDYTQSFPFSRD